ncbi:SDR family oxidoreductase [Bacillus inaquosorum]|uniref:SDR family oxidoreductase n=1 Tax=Bacillus inaquosorum TaxID=483913 RepID=A0A9Q4ETA0_9BACI|nr:SDR family oxidoreductase [Bacillus inaquosorum]MCY7788673.1 SDR family oxidoreductase [Bacillus inaquosorum]MCY7822056.1 SDR family oxidoreductase [Bacillus inaquosorum]MCY7936650.1 SDR family oxidoreductase [Bacillus inaquosorum]MCY8082248.1 SDR family oxidoreductase [Bacillus inaquosorum]MCY8163764.1 SDR family oxidoreductase [Bacillus inaquosorum]
MNPMDRQTEGQEPQHQDRQPGIESEMNPLPLSEDENYQGSGKLKGKVAIITGGDSGIGRAAAIAFAKEGADISILYLDEHSDAEETRKRIEKEHVRCLLIPGDVGDENYCEQAVQQTVDHFGKLDILVNNAAEQHPQDSILNISTEQLEKTFRTNIFSMFHMTKKALPHLREGSAIINTTSITAYEGDTMLIDYSSTKGAIVSFTRSMAMSLADKGIRVNAVAPGPIWTPLIPATFPEKKVKQHGLDTPMRRPGQPVEHAGAYVLLASDESSYMTGQTIHVNGGRFIST